MSDRPVFIYAATYADVVGAEADYDALLDLHAAKLVGTYDVALVNKDLDGKVHVRSTRSRPSTAPGEASPSERRSGFWPRRRLSPRRWSAASSAASADTSKRASQETPPRNWGTCSKRERQRYS